MYYETKDKYDYKHRIQKDKISDKDQITEILGFYYKNSLGKRLLNCDLRENQVYKGNSDKFDLLYDDNVFLYSKNILNNTINLIDYDHYESKHSTHENFDNFTTKEHNVIDGPSIIAGAKTDTIG